MFYSARYYETNGATSNLADKQYIDLTSEFTPLQLRDIYLNLTVVIETIEDHQLNEILNILEDTRNKQKIVVAFERYFNVLENNRRKIRETTEAIEALVSESKQKNDELRQLNRRMIAIRNEIVAIMEKNFKAKFNINVPTIN